MSGLGGGLDTCACKRGFFTLRDCENPATSTCSICSRRMCDTHLAPRVGAKVCVECAARQEEEQAVRPGLAQEDPTQADLPARYRRRYYRDYDYQPMWWGSYDPLWDSSGYRSYESDDYDDRSGGFGDS